MKLGKNKCFGGKTVLVATLLALFACAPAPRQTLNEGTVNRFVAAFNRHDTTAMLAETTEDIIWYSVDGESQQIETQGQQQLQQTMNRYFNSLPSAQSSLLEMSSSGDFVSSIEKAQWQSKEKLQAQCAVAVYQLNDKKIRRVWYFPPTQC